jgi:hypothetical protein
MDLENLSPQELADCFTISSSAQENASDELFKAMLNGALKNELLRRLNLFEMLIKNM